MLYRRELGSPPLGWGVSLQALTSSSQGHGGRGTVCAGGSLAGALTLGWGDTQDPLQWAGDIDLRGAPTPCAEGPGFNPQHCQMVIMGRMWEMGGAQGQEMVQGCTWLPRLPPGHHMVPQASWGTGGPHESPTSRPSPLPAWGLVPLSLICSLALLRLLPHPRPHPEPREGQNHFL